MFPFYLGGKIIKGDDVHVMRIQSLRRGGWFCMGKTESLSFRVGCLFHSTPGPVPTSSGESVRVPLKLSKSSAFRLVLGPRRYSKFAICEEILTEVFSMDVLENFL